MSISAGGSTRSLRSFGELLVVGGEGHIAGARASSPRRYGKLEEFVREHWAGARLTHRWSAQDPVSWGPAAGDRALPPRLLAAVCVASGFGKWGLSSASFAGEIIGDLIAGRDNRWAARFDPGRVGLRGLPKLAQINAKVAVDFVGDRLLPPLRAGATDLPPGEARVIRDGLGRTGAFRDEEGALHGVSLRCTHLGCLLRFNSAERSWDCPCHGSRFDVDGAVLEGPATRPLEEKAVDKGLSTPESVVVGSAERAPEHPEQPEDHSDHEQDAADRVEDAGVQQSAKHDQDYT